MRKEKIVMNETIKDLEQKRIAVLGVFNDLYDDVREEVYIDIINRLKDHIKLLEGELDEFKQLYDFETKRAEMWKKQVDFMTKVKTITVT